MMGYQNLNNNNNNAGRGGSSTRRRRRRKKVKAKEKCACDQKVRLGVNFKTLHLLASK